MQPHNLEDILAQKKYAKLKNIVERSRTYIDSKMNSEYDMINASRFIQTYYLNPHIKKEKIAYTKEIYKVLINEFNYDKDAAKILAKATPLPIQNKMGKIILAAGYGLFVGRINEHHFDTFCLLAGLDKKEAYHHALWGEYGSNALAAMQNTLLYGLASYAKKIITGSEMTTYESGEFGNAYFALRTIATAYDHHEFMKKGKYKPYYWSATTLSGAIIWSLSAYHNLKLRNKRTRFISKHFDDESFLGRNFSEMKELHNYIKKNTRNGNNNHNIRT